MAPFFIVLRVLGGGQTRAHGADPGTERAPDQLGRGGGEDLEQTLGDETELDMAMVSRELAADGVAVASDLRCRYGLPLTRRRGVLAAIQK
jgi:hypothetical protein